MTNAKISATAKSVLKNRALSSAIARALVKNSHVTNKDGIMVRVDGKEYIVRIASPTNAVISIIEK